LSKLHHYYKFCLKKKIEEKCEILPNFSRLKPNATPKLRMRKPWESQKEEQPFPLRGKKGQKMERGKAEKVDIKVGIFVKAISIEKEIKATYA